MPQLTLYQRLTLAVLNFFFLADSPVGSAFYTINATRNLFLAHQAYDKQNYAEFMDRGGFAYSLALVSYDKYLKRRDILRARSRRALRLFFALVILLCMLFTSVAAAAHAY